MDRLARWVTDCFSICWVYNTIIVPMLDYLPLLWTFQCLKDAASMHFLSDSFTILLYIDHVAWSMPSHSTVVQKVLKNPTYNTHIIALGDVSVYYDAHGRCSLFVSSGGCISLLNTATANWENHTFMQLALCTETLSCLMCLSSFCMIMEFSGTELYIHQDSYSF